MEGIIAILFALVSLAYFVFILAYVIIIANRLAVLATESRRQSKLLEELVQLIGSSGDE